MKKLVIIPAYNEKDSIVNTVKDIKDFPISMPASDVYDWAKEKFKPSYVWNEIGEKPTEFNPTAHKHVVNEITDFPETMRNPYSISIRLNNGTTEDLDLFTYNGDGEKSINITPIKSILFPLITSV